MISHHRCICLTPVLPLQSQYNAPIADLGTTGIPANRVQTACGLFSDSSMQGSDLLSAMVTAMGIFTANASLANGCLDITGATPEPEPEPYVPAEAPASAIASLAPGPELSNPNDAVFVLSAGDKFAYQVSHAMHTRLHLLYAKFWSPIWCRAQLGMSRGSQPPHIEFLSKQKKRNFDRSYLTAECCCMVLLSDLPSSKQSKAATCQLYMRIVNGQPAESLLFSLALQAALCMNCFLLTLKSIACYLLFSLPIWASCRCATRIRPPHHSVEVRPAIILCYCTSWPFSSPLDLIFRALLYYK